MGITFAQATQMLLGMFFRIAGAMLAGVSADGVQVSGWVSVLLSLLTDVAYLLLFVRFADQRRVAYAHRHGHAV